MACGALHSSSDGGQQRARVPLSVHVTTDRPWEDWRRHEWRGGEGGWREGCRYHDDTDWGWSNLDAQRGGWPEQRGWRSETQKTKRHITHVTRGGAQFSIPLANTSFAAAF